MAGVVYDSGKRHLIEQLRAFWRRHRYHESFEQFCWRLENEPGFAERMEAKESDR